MLTMLGILHALIVDCPAAFVFNITEPPDRAELKPNSITFQLCGSPLDQLPFPEEVLTRHFPVSASKMTQILRMRLQEIRQRSRTVEMRWALSSSSQSGFGSSFPLLFVEFFRPLQNKWWTRASTCSPLWT